MTKLFNRFLMLMGIMGVTACGSGGGDDVDNPEVIVSETTIALTGQSISNGAEVDASTTKTLTLTFGNNSLTRGTGNITLNGTAVNASVSPKAVNQVVVDLSLEEGKTYAFSMPKGAFTKKADANAKTEAVSFSFKTKEKAVITYNFDPLTNSKATPEAKALYKLFLDNYGKKMFSGAMGGVAWETTFSDYIYKNTGKYPAVVGFDFIHLPYAPANWIDYSKLESIKSVSDNGGIVQIGWHWVVPKSKDDKDNSYSADTKFDISAALTEGTWQNDFIKADIAEVAGYLKLLQDANIPVVFRPLHEAAGDYGSQGAWFWWGAKGYALYKRLWIYLHDQLVNTYGLNNLIWVYTAQTSTNGALAPKSDILNWYPGDEYVDIVGADLYFDGALQQGWDGKKYTTTQAYHALNDAFGGRKMLVLSECGKLPNASTFISAGEPWGYFMSWYDWDTKSSYFINNWNTLSDWQTKLKDGAVLNRGDFQMTK